jgi:hypothetical protein
MAARRPRSGLVGWAAAWTILERVRDEALRGLLADLAREAGVGTAPGLKYLAGLLRCYAGDADHPTPPLGLSTAEIGFIDVRARDLLRPYVGDPRCRRMRPLEARKAA